MISRPQSTIGGPDGSEGGAAGITNGEGNRLLRIVRRDSGSVVTWRRAQIVLLSAQAMNPAKISEVVFTDPDTVREVIPQLQPRRLRCLLSPLRGQAPPAFTLPQRREIKKIALSIPADLGRPFATWSLAKLSDYLVAEGGGHGHPRQTLGWGIPPSSPFGLMHPLAQRSGVDDEVARCVGFEGKMGPAPLLLRHSTEPDDAIGT